MGLTYVRLDTTSGLLHVPNASVLAAGVGPWQEDLSDSSAALPATDT